MIVFVSGFANAISVARGDRASLALLWLGGLLEGEGTFLRPPPSSPNCPIVSCSGTDRDVVERVAERFGTGISVIDKGAYRTEYRATLKGVRAVALLDDLRPIMGSRRREAIDRALEGYRPPSRKLDFAAAEEIRREHRSGRSAASLARDYRVTHPTIRAVLSGRIYRAPAAAPWRTPATYLPDVVYLPRDLSPGELFWLAGWLEGEGSFLAPPPSKPRAPRISATTRDRDVAAEVARLLGVSALADNHKRARERGWSPTWSMVRQGGAAVELMRAVRVLMGVRRTAQIRRALRATAEASAIRLNGAESQDDPLRRRSGAVIRSKVETPGVEPESAVAMQRLLQA
jgi:hypothetical protein